MPSSRRTSATDSRFETEVLAASFARLDVRSAAESAKVELGLDWRKNKPISLAVGPVLHADDAVANKVCALFGRAEVRDYVDVDAILASGRYTEDELLDLAADHDPGFDRSWFAEALAAIDRLPDRLFQPYGLGPRKPQRSRPDAGVGAPARNISLDRLDNLLPSAAAVPAFAAGLA